MGVILVSKDMFWSAPEQPVAQPLSYRPTDGPSDLTPATAEPTDTPSPSPYDRAYTGKVDDLPDAVKAVLNFTPVDDADQTQGTSILERVETVCGLSDYLGSGDLPGIARYAPPQEHGWVRVTWKPGKCTGLGSAFPNPTLQWDISADQDHLRQVGDVDGATYMLTH